MLDQVPTALFDDRSKYVDRFGLLLLVTVLAVAVQSLVDVREPFDDLGNVVGLVIDTFFVGAAFLLALQASGIAHRWQMVANIVVGVAFAVTLLMLVADLFIDIDPTVTDTGAPLAFLTLAVLAPIVVVRRLVQHRRVTRGTLLGAIAAYLLIALALDFAFLTVDALQAAPFFGQHEPSTSFMYYSLVTITTLGYGDLVASTDLGRLISTTGAVIGQVFLVTFVAMLVGLLIQTRRPATE